MARFDHLELGPDPTPPNSRAGDRQSRAKPTEEQNFLRLADHHRRRGEHESALRFYSRALEQDKNLIVGWCGQVRMLIQLEEAPEAELWSRKALELFPNNGDLLAARAQALCRIGNLREAGAACDGAMQAAGKSAFRWLARGEWMLATRQKLDEHAFAKAREVDADWLVAIDAATTYLHYRFPSRAIKWARQATGLAPDQFYPWCVQGLAEAAAGMSAAAAESLNHCLQLCPRHADAKARLRSLDSRFSIAGFVRRFFGK